MAMLQSPGNEVQPGTAEHGILFCPGAWGTGLEELQEVRCTWVCPRRARTVTARDCDKGLEQDRGIFILGTSQRNGRRWGRTCVPVSPGTGVELGGVW